MHRNAVDNDFICIFIVCLRKTNDKNLIISGLLDLLSELCPVPSFLKLPQQIKAIK
jgi:hypothetical protein